MEVEQMNYRIVLLEEADKIYDIVQQTIKNIYPKYYPAEVVDFFVNHHNIDAIKLDIQNGNVSALIVDDVIVGTGSFVDNHITRVYVLPEYQGRGYGKFIMSSIEREIAKKHTKVFLDASLPAAHIYEKLGYKTIKHEKYSDVNGCVLAYEVMEKKLHKTETDINYDGKYFITKTNSENGEANSETIFVYYQNGNIVWAEYGGGNIEKGTLIGTVAQNGVLEFNYQHVNVNEQIRIGRCISTPRILDNGKIELVEEWQWLDGDYGIGTSVLMEM